MTKTTFMNVNMDNQDMSKKDFGMANLHGSSFKNCDLRLANLKLVKAMYVDFRGANLTNANLSGGNFKGADFSGADLSMANLWSASFFAANFKDAILPFYQIIPDEGSFIAYKAVNGYVLKIRIPESACRTSVLVSRGCRASCVEVLDIKDKHGNTISETLHSDFYPHTSYAAGSITTAHRWSDDITMESNPGIHFYVTKEEAAIHADWSE